MFAFVWQNNYIIQQTEVTVHFTSKQLLMFAFVWQNNYIIQQTEVTVHFTSK